MAEDMGILLSDEDISAILKNVLDKYHRRFSAWVVVQSMPIRLLPKTHLYGRIASETVRMRKDGEMRGGRKEFNMVAGREQR